MCDVVVPLDGTPMSESALPWAQAIATRSGGSLRLVHVHIPLRVPTCQEVLGERVGETLRQVKRATREREAEYLRDTGGRLEISHPTPEVSTAVLRGPLSGALLDDADRSRATLFVMATRPLRGLERLRQGSLTDELVRQCPIPVLVVRGQDTAADAADAAVPGAAAGTAGGAEGGVGPEVSRVLVPLDGTARAEGAVPYAIRLARLFEAGLVLVRVVRSGADEAEATRYLEGVRARLHPTGVSAEARVVAGRRVADALTEAAREAGAGLIAMASRTRNGLPRLVLGSVADAVVKAGGCPVLVVGRQALRDPGERGRVVAWR